VQVVSDRPDYHSEDLIFPVGFCSTRVYGSLKDPERKCVYTCKIVDGGTAPRYVANVLVYFLPAKPGSCSCYEKVFLLLYMLLDWMLVYSQYVVIEFSLSFCFLIPSMDITPKCILKFVPYS
jgi:hypothetical protein